MSNSHSLQAVEKQVALYNRLQCLHHHLIIQIQMFYSQLPLGHESSHRAVIRGECSLVCLHLNEYISLPGSAGWAFWDGLLMKACLAVRTETYTAIMCFTYRVLRSKFSREV